MGVAQMSNNRPGDKGLAEQNYDKKYDNKNTRGGVTGEGQELSEEDELRIHEDMDGVSNAQIEAAQVQDLAHRQAFMSTLQPQPKESVVRWERFLPIRSLKVLLVESDDSTRHVVSALLRNCGYEVTDVANGGQAWKILEDLTTHIDLVLTEVSMPCMSGIALLSKIMRHKTRKNIPVIMISSHGTMGIVFKCLSKGAADFLVKPIRKNELKNLWQHVWRRCHSSIGSGSESGIHTQKSNKLRSGECDNNSGSNDEDDIESIGVNARDGSDNGSGTQSSWTKRAIEIDSPQRISTWDQLADPPDSTCAQVIHSRLEVLSTNCVPVNPARDFEGENAETGNDSMGKDLEIGVPRNAEPQIEDSRKKIMAADNTTQKDPQIDCERNGDQLEMNQSEPGSEKTEGESQNKAVDLLGFIATNTDPQMESIDFNSPGGLLKASDVKDEEMPSLKLSLKRTRDVQDIERSAHDRNVLRHSDLSAFSKYSSAPPSNPTGIVGSCSPAGNRSEAAKTESAQNLQSNSNSAPCNQGSNGGSNGSSNNNDMGSTTNDAVKRHHPSSAFQPVDGNRVFPLRPSDQGGNKADASTDRKTLIQPWEANQHVKLHYRHHHYHMMSDNDDTGSGTGILCDSPNMLVEGNATNHSLNGSASGSNHASNNGQNGSSVPLNAQEMDHNGNKMVESCVSGLGIGLVDRNMIDQNRIAQREAALYKFRQKRKQRCFEKKVRYYSRKKLAEQRPRIRGQFVRQNGNNNTRVDDPS